MGGGVKTDIERVKAKNKSLLEIPRLYHRDDEGRKYRRKYQETEETDEVNFDKEFLLNDDDD